MANDRSVVCTGCGGTQKRRRLSNRRVRIEICRRLCRDRGVLCLPTRYRTSHPMAQELSRAARGRISRSSQPRGLLQDRGVRCALPGAAATDESRQSETGTANQLIFGAGRVNASSRGRSRLPSPLAAPKTRTVRFSSDLPDHAVSTASASRPWVSAPQFTGATVPITSPQAPIPTVTTAAAIMNAQ
jgi:hypothetical protein